MPSLVLHTGQCISCLGPSPWLLTLLTPSHDCGFSSLWQSSWWRPLTCLPPCIASQDPVLLCSQYLSLCQISLFLILLFCFPPTERKSRHCRGFLGCIPCYPQHLLHCLLHSNPSNFCWSCMSMEIANLRELNQDLSVLTCATLQYCFTSRGKVMTPGLLFDVHADFLGILVKIQILISNKMPPGCSDNTRIGVTLFKSCCRHINGLPEMATS